MNENTSKVLQALRAHTESTEYWSDGRIAGHVYLDNAKHDLKGMSAHAFAGHLSALEAANLYRPVDGMFGDVMIKGRFGK